MSFKRKFNTPTKMAPGNDDDDDVTRHSFNSRPSSARAADYWSTTSAAGGSADATIFPNAFAGTDLLPDFRTRYRLSARKSPDCDPTSHLGRERKTEADGDDAWRQPEVDGDDDVMGNIRSVIGSAATVDEKQRVLSLMISQLQSLKQNLFQQKSNGVRIVARSLYTADLDMCRVQWRSQSSVSGGAQLLFLPPFSHFLPSIPFHFPLNSLFPLPSPFTVALSRKSSSRV